ncbi:MAG TPA: penicillin-binding transpeptidase domain-containing protein [Longimicrobiaceae bacterium]|nr:penicillin-binding transpeptidase domain-containing protein [Longimicrobiaceae bacterium]
MDLLLNTILLAIFVSLGAGAGTWITRWFRSNWRQTNERWTMRVAVGMLVLVGVYAAAHLRLLAQRGSIEEGRERYAVFGDPRRTELRRGEVRGWVLDCTGDPGGALASYRERDGVVEREYALGAGGANFVGGGPEAEERDYTVEALFAPRLREARNLLELGELHPAGKDLHLTLCRDLTQVAYRQLAQTGLPGAVVVQDVRTGAVLAYAASGGPSDPPLGIKRYSPPGSVFKLALAAVWWENGLPDEIPIPCPAQIEVTARATIGNYGGAEYGTLNGPVEMLVPSCNTAAVWMALEARRQIGEEPFIESYRRFGFLPYESDPPTDSIGDFWETSSSAWTRRMTPAPSRIRLSASTGDAEWAQLSIGQGPVDVTVVGVSRFIQSIANDGVMLPPSFEFDLAKSPPRGDRVMSEQTARTLRAAMRQVVVRGTARSAGAVMEGTGWRLAGKTGTAQVPGRADNGWFAAMLSPPEGDPQFTIVAFVEGGGPGGGGPARIVANVARELAEHTPPAIADE